jgi:hypothetical protein
LLTYLREFTFDPVVKRRATIISVLSLLAAALVQLPTQVTPAATVHVVDDRKAPVAGVTVYRSWEHYRLRREGHQDSQTTKSGEVTFPAQTVWGSALSRALAPALSIVSPHVSTGARTRFEIYCPIGYRFRRGDVADLQSESGGHVFVDYDPPHPKSTIQYSARVCLDFGRRDRIDFTLPVQKDGLEKP